MGDRDAVIDTVNRYATALDTREWGLLDQVFTADAEGEFGGGTLRGLDALRSLVQGALGGCGATQHLLGNHRVELAGDRARCVCQVRAYHAGAGRAAGGHYELLGEYRDELVRTAEGWRIARRRLRVLHEIGSRDVLGP